MTVHWSGWPRLTVHLQLVVGSRADEPQGDNCWLALVPRVFFSALTLLVWWWQGHPTSQNLCHLSPKIFFEKQAKEEHQREWLTYFTYENRHENNAREVLISVLGHHMVTLINFTTLRQILRLNKHWLYTNFSTVTNITPRLACYMCLLTL